MPNFLLRETRERLKKTPWQRPKADPVPQPSQAEPPRYMIRADVLWFTLLFGAGLAVVLALLDNPLAKVQDLRVGTRYDSKPLTSLAAEPGGRTLWLGSSGGGVKVFDPHNHFFRSDLTRASSGGKLLSDFVMDLDIGSNASSVGVIVTTDGADGPGGLQAADAGVSPKLWDKPIVDLSRFPGLTDSNATAVAATADRRHLVFGTRGFGVAVYQTETHSWQPAVTSRNGLPSDNVTDLVVADGAAGAEVVWVATDRGLCAGPLDGASRLAVQWHWRTQDGLAGEQIDRLHLHDGYVWYLTHGGGLGRVALDATGGPRGSGAHQLLVSERQLPGLGDEHLQLAAGSPAGPTTWFSAAIGQTSFIGRYREMPCDTFGVPMPVDLAGAKINSVSTDPDTGSALLLGSSRGVWFFSDASGPALGAITAGLAGLGNENVLEVALGGTRSTAKLQAGEIPWLASVAANTSPLPWDWAKLVGPGRFTDLTSKADIFCMTGDSNRVWFGTKGKGIGLWDRAGMEVTQALSSQASTGSNRLRNDTSLDLALVDGALVQVTGDHAVDVFRAGRDRLELIPAGGAPFASGEITTVAAQGRYFVAATKGAVAYYDQSAFHWTVLPGLEDIKRMEFAGEYMWALTGAGQLYRIELTGEGHSWQSMTSGVRSLAVAHDTVYALTESLDTLEDSLIRFGAGAAEGKVIAGSGALPPGDWNWRLAAADGSDLYMLGSGQVLQRYSLAERKWKSVSLPDELRPPFKQAVRSTSGWYFLDASGSLHCFRFADQHFSVGLDSGVERIDALGAGLLALRNGSDGDLLVLRGEREDSARVLIGQPFQGDLGRIIDATEWNGQLVVAESTRIATYDWASHSWSKPLSSASPIRRFYSSGAALWVELTGESGGLHQVSAAGLRQVDLPAEAAPLQRVSAADGGLYALDHKGRVLFIPNSAPTRAELLLAASALSGAAPTSRDNWALMEDAPVVATGTQVQIFRSNGGPPVWQAADLGAEIRILAGGSEHKLLAATASGVREVLLDGEGRLSSRPINLPAANGPFEVKGMAVTPGESLVAAQAGGEAGLRVWSVDAASRATPVIGSSLAGPQPTRAVVELPNNEGLIRLEEAGRSAEYTVNNHSWSTVTGPKLDALFRLGETVYGFSRAGGLLCSLSGGGWSGLNSTGEQITNVQAFPKGVLLWRADGHLGLCAQGGIHWCWSPPQTANPIAELGEIKDVAEVDDALVLLGANGGLAGYDWPAQHWLQSNIKDARQLVRHGRQVYVLRGPQDSQALAGPVGMSAGALVAEPLASTTPIRAAAVAGDDLFVLGQDGKIGRMNQRRFEPWWGQSRAQGQPARPMGKALSAVQMGGALWAVLEQDENTPYVLKLDNQTLTSETRPLPPGRIESIFEVTNQSLYAVQTMPEGRRILDIASGRIVAPPTTNAGVFGFEDGKFRIATKESILEAGETNWNVVTNQPLDATSESRLAATLVKPAESLVEDAAGAWRDARRPERRLGLATGSAEKRWKLLPAADGNGLACEHVNDIAGYGGALVAATDGGIVEFQPNSAGTVENLYVPSGTADSGRVYAFVQADTLLAITSEGRWVGRAPNGWLEASAPSAAASLAANIRRANGSLENWRWTQGREFQRKTRAGEFRDTRLGPNGFDFEFVQAAEVGDDGRLWLHTAAGSSLYGAVSSESSPDDLLPQWAMPPGIKQGFVLRLPDGSRWLSPSPEPGPAAEGTLWAGGTGGWQTATPEQRQALKAFATGPLLDSQTWRWERPGTQAEEQVTWKLSTGGVRSAFSRVSGRFGWDICYGVGQAEAGPWLLTDAGLFQVRDSNVDIASQKEAPAPPSQLRFAETSGAMPGGLFRGDALVAVYDGTWHAVADASPAVTSMVRDYRSVSRHWTLRRDGTVLRALPQSLDTFVPVHLLATRRWDFETVADLAASKDWCHLATAAGMAGLRNNSDLAGLWPETGQASGVGAVGRLPVAEAGGRRFEFDGERWAESAYRGPLSPPVMTNDLAHFRVVRQKDGGATLALKLADGTARELSLRGSRLPFDDVTAAALVGDGKPFTVTSMGTWEIGPGGDLVPEAGLGQQQKPVAEFFRVAENPDQWTLYAHTSERTYRWSEASWQPLASGDAARVEKLRQERLAYSQTWRVDASPGADIEFRLRLNEDRNGRYRLTPFDREHGRFGFDALITVAGNGDALYLGSKAGLERLDENGNLKRLWCQLRDGDQMLDGIGPEPVEQLAFGQTKALQMRVSGKYYQIETEYSAAAVSTRERYLAAASLRQADPDGWRVVHSLEEGQPLQMWWRNQPVFLVPGDDGKTHFAHNIVHSATEVNGHLALGTAGGLLILDAVNATPGESSRLLCAPFQQRSVTNQPPAALNWLQKQESGVIIAKSTQGDTWRVSEPDAKVTGEVAPPDLAKSREKIVVSDDLLQWAHPDSGQVKILFSTNRVFPPDIQPAFQNGTFTFADLRVGEAGGTSGTLQATPWGLFWLTRAGVMQMNTQSGEVIALQQMTADNKTPLNQLTELRLVPTNRVLYARGPNVILAFDAINGRWKPAPPEDNPFQDRQLVNSSPMLEWRQDAGRVRVEMKASDQPSMLVFHQGKPAVDQVHEIAFVTESGEDHLLLATDGGVVVRQAGNFEFCQRYAAAFSPDAASAPVQAVVAVAEGENWRQGARTPTGKLFERTGGKWSESNSVQQVFEAGYLRVQDPVRWDWARYPAGLSCRVQHVNGPELRLGAAVDGSFPPAFSRGKISLDDIRGAVVVNNTVLSVTPVGVVRFLLSPPAQRADFDGLDVWARETAGGAPMPVMTGLRGVARDHGLQIWNDHSVYANLQERQWAISPVQLRALQTERQLAGGGKSWRSAIESSHPGELRVDYRGFASGSSWFVPTSGTNIINAVSSEGDLWVLTSDGLYETREKKLRESVWEITGLGRNGNLRN